MRQWNHPFELSKKMQKILTYRENPSVIDINARQ